MNSDYYYCLLIIIKIVINVIIILLLLCNTVVAAVRTVFLPPTSSVAYLPDYSDVTFFAAQTAVSRVVAARRWSRLVVATTKWWHRQWRRRWTVSGVSSKTAVGCRRANVVGKWNWPERKQGTSLISPPRSSRSKPPPSDLPEARRRRAFRARAPLVRTSTAFPRARVRLLPPENSPEKSPPSPASYRDRVYPFSRTKITAAGVGIYIYM